MANLPIGSDGGNNQGGGGNEFRRRERKNYYVALNIGRTGTGEGPASAGGGLLKIPFRGVEALYGSIKDKLGVQLVAENDNVLSDLYGLAGKTLPKLRLGLSGGGLNTGTGNQAQQDSSKSATCFVNPDKISSALRDLQGSTAYGMRITTVRIPRRRVYI
ncbi:hypothetical protein [Egbenema bharatensis]|uniref:hypothetical protein n=1 Tax=Egbenema bharatensis TaxID=3463334 RepID=UPI003A8596C9